MRLNAARIGCASVIALAIVSSTALGADPSGISNPCTLPVNFANQGNGSRSGPVTIVPIIWGEAPSTSVTQLESELDQVYSQLEQSNYYKWLRNEYGAPQIQHVYPTSSVWQGQLSGVVKEDDVKSSLDSWVRSGATPKVSNPLYVLHLPPGVTTDNMGQNCSTAVGFNTAYQTFDLFNGGYWDYYLAVVADPASCGLGFNGMTRVLSHEVVESVTDGANFNVTGAHNNGWEDPSQPSSCGDQIGDLCNGQATVIQSPAQRTVPGSGNTHSLTVQKMWSNQLHACVTEDTSTTPAVTSVTSPATVTYDGAEVPTGLPGTVVTITGTNLEGSPTVTFGGTAALASCSSSTQCTVTAPSGPAGLVPLTFSENGTTLSIGNYDYDPAGPVCTASTDCAGAVNVSCTGPNVWIIPEGQYAEVTVYPGTSTSASSRWIGTTTGVNMAEACTTDGIASNCIQVDAGTAPSCPTNPEPPPLCNPGYKWCTRYNACVLPQLCLVQKPTP